MWLIDTFLQVTMGDTALMRHQSLIERPLGNIVENIIKEKRDKLKQKLVEAHDSPNHLEIMTVSPPTQVLDAQYNLEDPEGEEDNTILEAVF